MTVVTFANTNIQIRNSAVSPTGAGCRTNCLANAASSLAEATPLPMTRGSAPAPLWACTTASRTESN